jgi:hypothetical protein
MLYWALAYYLDAMQGLAHANMLERLGSKKKVVGFLNTLSYCQLCHGNCSHRERIVGVLVY